MNEPLLTENLRDQTEAITAQVPARFRIRPRAIATWALRYPPGPALKLREIALALDISDTTVSRDIRLMKAAILGDADFAGAVTKFIVENQRGLLDLAVAARRSREDEDFEPDIGTLYDPVERAQAVGVVHNVRQALYRLQDSGLTDEQREAVTTEALAPLAELETLLIHENQTRYERDENRGKALARVGAVRSWIRGLATGVKWGSVTAAGVLTALANAESAAQGLDFVAEVLS